MLGRFAVGRLVVGRFAVVRFAGARDAAAFFAGGRRFGVVRFDDGERVGRAVAARRTGVAARTGARRAPDGDEAAGASTVGASTGGAFG